MQCMILLSMLRCFIAHRINEIGKKQATTNIILKDFISLIMYIHYQLEKKYCITTMQYMIH